MDSRPELTKDIVLIDFQSFYWLKKELVDFCRREGLTTQGDKITITKRIEQYLLTGEKETVYNRRKPTATFDWNTVDLTLQTVITDNYKNTENVRAFFKKHLGQSFKFNVQFMNWMKSNVGKTLAEATVTWKAIKTEKQQNKTPKDIAPQFEYNTYIRDFLVANPSLTKKEAIICWKIKRATRGDNKYHPSDVLQLE